MDVNDYMLGHFQIPIAHRGLHGPGPDESGSGPIENTFPAFDAAIVAGVGIECDVRGALDSEPVVFHDRDLVRLAGLSEPVAGHTADDLSEIKLSPRGDTIPRLSDVLELVAGRVPLVIEIKAEQADRDRALCGRLGSLLETYAGTVAVKSFEPRVVNAIRQYVADVPVGLVAASTISPQIVVETDPEFVSLRVADLETSLARLRRSEVARPAMTWTVRSTKELDCAVAQGALPVFEALDPDVVKRLWGNRRWPPDFDQTTEVTD